MSRRYGRRQRRRHRQRIAELERLFCPCPEPGDHVVLEGFWTSSQERFSHGSLSGDSRELYLHGVCCNLDSVDDAARKQEPLWHASRLWIVQNIWYITTVSPMPSPSHVEIELVETCSRDFTSVGK